MMLMLMLMLMMLMMMMVMMHGMVKQHQWVRSLRRRRCHFNVYAPGVVAECGAVVI